MPANARWGELLVGAYHQRVTGCEVVSYNNRSEEQGNQMESDLIAIDNDRSSEGQHIYVCEIVTHLNGGLYSGTPDEEGWWMNYSNTAAYHSSLETLWRKFLDSEEYAKQAFPGAESYSFQFWAPKVKGGKTDGPLIDGLEALSTKFEEETDEELEVIINRGYTERIEDLREEARGDTSDYGSPAFRFLQILENLE
ncbi:hypothetical protein [Haloarcula argentinensis]|uniref:Uncharacterized protein n=1 Tax=Haloarcula argentinensis TaxID=43776 RepID=A0A830FTZ1_HALAR|nr:hypothetical protein [Haloarcula argentinensis]GGM40087.1 hypothetical protein GCM10009006_21480 [Haloarcula argentinensis]